MAGTSFDFSWTNAKENEIVLATAAERPVMKGCFEISSVLDCSGYRKMVHLARSTLGC